MFLLALAAVLDLAVAALLIAVSGFLFGAGPDSVHLEQAGLALYGGGVAACLAAPVAGFILNANGKQAPGFAIAWLPVAGALVALMAPAPY